MRKVWGGGVCFWASLALVAAEEIGGGVLDAIPEGFFEVAAEFLGDVLNVDEDVVGVGQEEEE